MSSTDYPGSASGVRPGSSAARARKTMIFANDKSSGKTTTANAVIVSLLQRYPVLMKNIEVREYERHPRLSMIFRKEDGIGSITHRDARNAAAFDMSRELAYDPNATPWDDLLYDIGIGNLIVDLGSNMFTEICRILDDEPRPIFPEGGGPRRRRRSGHHRRRQHRISDRRDRQRRQLGAAQPCVRGRAGISRAVHARPA